MLRIKKHPQGCLFVLVFHGHWLLRTTTLLWHRAKPQRTPPSLVVYAHLFMLRIKKHPQGCFFVLVFHCHFPLRRTTTLWHSVPKWQFSPLRSPTPNAVALGWASLVVGVARFELAASWSRTKRATKLRYTPFSVLVD